MHSLERYLVHAIRYKSSRKLKHGPKGILKGTPEAVLLASILKPKYLMSNDKPYSIFTLFVAHFLLFTNLFNWGTLKNDISVII